MAKYRVTKKSFIDNKLVDEGAIVEVDEKVMTPGSNLQLVVPAKKGKPADGDLA